MYSKFSTETANPQLPHLEKPQKNLNKNTSNNRLDVRVLLREQVGRFKSHMGSSGVDDGK